MTDVRITNSIHSPPLPKAASNLRANAGNGLTPQQTTDTKLPGPDSNASLDIATTKDSRLSELSQFLDFAEMAIKAIGQAKQRLEKIQDLFGKEQNQLSGLQKNGQLADQTSLTHYLQDVIDRAQELVRDVQDHEPPILDLPQEAIDALLKGKNDSDLAEKLANLGKTKLTSQIRITLQVSTTTISANEVASKAFEGFDNTKELLTQINDILDKGAHILKQRSGFTEKLAITLQTTHSLSANSDHTTEGAALLSLKIRQSLSETSHSLSQKSQESILRHLI